MHFDKRSLLSPTTYYTTNFANTALTGDKITVTHNLGSSYPHVSAYDAANNMMIPGISNISDNAVSIDFTGITNASYNVRVSL